MTWGQALIGISLSLGLGIAVATAQGQNPNGVVNSPLPSNNNEQTPFITNPNPARPLRIEIAINSLDELKITQGEIVKANQILADNSTERKRLLDQKRKLTLQLNQIKSKQIPKPVPPASVPELAGLPAPNYDEEYAAIDQAKLKLEQAKQLKNRLSSSLESMPAGEAANFEKLNTNLEAARTKVSEQEQLIDKLKDMGINEPDVIQHESAKLAALQQQAKAIEFELQTAQAKLAERALSVRQELAQLEINYQLAQSQVKVAESKLQAKQSDYQMKQYEHNINLIRRAEEKNQAQLTQYNQQQRYLQDISDRDYQVAQLELALSQIDDKLSAITVIRAARGGMVRRLKIGGQTNGKINVSLVIADIDSANGSTKNFGSSTNSNSRTTSKGSNSKANSNATDSTDFDD